MPKSKLQKSWCEVWSLTFETLQSKVWPRRGRNPRRDFSFQIEVDEFKIFVQVLDFDLRLARMSQSARFCSRRTSGFSSSSQIKRKSRTPTFFFPFPERKNATVTRPENHPETKFSVFGRGPRRVCFSKRPAQRR